MMAERALKQSVMQPPDRKEQKRTKMKENIQRKRHRKRKGQKKKTINTLMQAAKKALPTWQGITNHCYKKHKWLVIRKECVDSEKGRGCKTKKNQIK